jgi:2-aminoadipate transaminase
VPRARPRGEVAFHYRMPWLNNPTGARMDASARAALLKAADIIVEDEAYAELAFDGPPGRPLIADARDRVWLVGSFSKTLSPGLRVGWLVAPRGKRHAASELKKLQDIQSNGLTQAALMDYLAHDDFDARLDVARRYYAGQADRLMAGVSKHLPDWRFTAPEGGFSLWLEAPEPGDGIAFLATAVRHGVTFDPGRMFLPSGRGRRLGLRVCFSGVEPEALDLGAKRLGAAWRDYRRSSRGGSAD